jgi:SAM-dependent methyltransferase
MTAADKKRIERIARESTDLARKSLKKSNELEAYLSVMEYRAGKIRRHKSVRYLFRKLKSYVRYLLYERFIVRFESNYDNPSDIPEDCLLKLPIPSYIDTILDVGCGNGRNLVPFDGKLKLWATDIVPRERIAFVRDFKNFTYEQCSVEELAKRFETQSIDLSKTLVFASGTLMYVKGAYQNRFFEACKNNRCKNFIFQDYEPGNPKHPFEYFKIPTEIFSTYRFRDQKGIGQPVC